jgi:hypothetical protein
MQESLQVRLCEGASSDRRLYSTLPSPLTGLNLGRYPDRPVPRIVLLHGDGNMPQHGVDKKRGRCLPDLRQTGFGWSR